MLDRIDGKVTQPLEGPGSEALSIRVEYGPGPAETPAPVRVEFGTGDEPGE